MKKSALVLALILLITTSASAEITLYEKENKIRVYTAGELTARYENWNWFDPAGSSADNNYSYQFIRSRLAIGAETDKIDFFVQAQHTQMWGLPDNAMAPAPGGALGLGAIYYAHSQSENYHKTFLKQAHVRFKDILGSGLSIKAGRFEYVDGLEVTYKNPKVMWLKKIRLSERMIGPFGWSAFTRSFDGAEISLDKENYNITSMASYPTQGGFENDAQTTIGDITLLTTTLTLKYDKVIPNTETRLFYYFYDDDRTMAKPDNTPAGSTLNNGEIEIQTLGFHLLNTFEAGPGTSDFLLWGAYQFGDWGELTHKAWAFNMEVGYQFTEIFSKPWLRAGYFISSGDSNPGDSDHETFFQMLPTARKYALFPFYNLMNNEDFFVQLILKPHKKILIRTDLHFLRLNQSEDKWYMGAGATRKNGDIFGYIARPSGGDTDLAKVWDLMVVFTLNKHMSFNTYYGHVWGGNVIENSYGADDSADLFFFELNLKF